MSELNWVVAGGKSGELGYCMRCGEGLTIGMPQRLEVAAAAMKAFANIHAHCQPGEYHEKPAQTPQEWAMGRDTGISSLTIYCAITAIKGDGHFDIPYDPDDFGRCYRLLKLFPAWRKNLAKTIEICPRWKLFVENWDELTGLFEAAGWHDLTRKPKGDDGKMYKRMQELRGR